MILLGKASRVWAYGETTLVSGPVAQCPVGGALIKSDVHGKKLNGTRKNPRDP
jgi:hypothetical protein